MELAVSNKPTTKWTSWSTTQTQTAITPQLSTSWMLKPSTNRKTQALQNQPKAVQISVTRKDMRSLFKTTINKKWWVEAVDSSLLMEGLTALVGEAQAVTNVKWRLKDKHLKPRTTRKETRMHHESKVTLETPFRTWWRHKINTTQSTICSSLSIQEQPG